MLLRLVYCFQRLRGSSGAQIKRAALCITRSQHSKLVTLQKHKQILIYNKSLHQYQNVQKVTAAQKLYNYKLFSTTPRRPIHPLVWLILKPFSKLSAILGGRLMRKWWGGLAQHERTHLLNRVGGGRRLLLGIVSSILIIIIVNYITHLQVNPMTGRRRYISLTHDQIDKAAEWEEQLILKNSKLLPANSNASIIISQVVFNILKANLSVSDKFEKLNWTVSVVDDEETENAFVLPNGHIFVYLGLLKSMDNIHQLAVILGHEMAHAVMEHTVEQLSHGQMIDFIAITCLAATWAFVPGNGIAIITQWFTDKLMQLMFHLPYSRELENEADKIGLEFAARACYDVREAPVYWNKMKALQEKPSNNGDKIQVSEWLSTHPTHENRTSQLNNLVPECIRLREACKCDTLSPKEPTNRDVRLPCPPQQPALVVTPAA